MDPEYAQIRVERRGDAYCVWLKRRRLTEGDLFTLGEELSALVTEQGCHKLALSLSNDQLECLYSMFIGKMVGLRRLLTESGGQIKLCEVGPMCLGVLKTVKLTELFDIVPTMDDAVAALQS
jgi:hypothetical protein